MILFGLQVCLATRPEPTRDLAGCQVSLPHLQVRRQVQSTVYSNINGVGAKFQSYLQSVPAPLAGQGGSSSLYSSTKGVGAKFQSSSSSVAAPLFCLRLYFLFHYICFLSIFSNASGRVVSKELVKYPSPQSFKYVFGSYCQSPHSKRSREMTKLRENFTSTSNRCARI